MAEGDNTNTPEEEKQVTEELEKQENILKDINKSLEKQVNYKVRLARMRGEEISQAQKLAMLLGEQADTFEELLEMASKRETNLEKIKEAQKKYEDSLDREVEKGRMLSQVAEEQKKIAREINQLKIDIIQDQNQENKQADEKLQLLLQQLDTQRKLTASQQSGVAAGANFVNSMASLVGMKPNPGFNDFIKSFSGGFGQGLASVANGIRMQLGEVFSLGNMFAFVASNALQLGLMFDGVASSIAATTGTGRKFVGQLAEVSSEMGKQGILVEEVGQAFQSLLRDFTLFSEIADGQVQNSIAATASQLQVLGVDASTTGDILNFFMATLKMTGEEANTTYRSMIEQGAALNIAPDQLAASLRQLQPRLAMFGQKAPDILMKTAAAAKSLGVEVGELGGNLFALSDGLDEFDEAASKVAAFNLALGGSFVDTFELVTAAADGPFAQVELLQQGLNRAGESLSDMPFQKQQFLAKNFGMEIDTLTAILDGTIKSQEELNKQQAENSKSIEDMVREATPALKDLQASLQNIFGPLGKIMEPIANGINFLSSALGDGLAYVMGGALIFAFGRFISNMKEAKKEAKEMSENVANIAKELRLLSMQTRKADIASIIGDEAKLFEQAKEQLIAMGHEGEISGEKIEEMAGFMKNALDIEDKELTGKIEEVSSSMSSLTEEGTKAGAAMDKLGGAVEGIGIGVSTGFAVYEAISAIEDGGLRAAAGIGAAAAALATAMVFKEGLLKGPAGLIGALALVGIAIGGIAAAFSDGPQSSPTSASIGSISAQGFQTTSGVDDAIIQNDGGSTKVTPINKSDQLIAAKPGGPVDEAFQRAGGSEGGQIPERLVAALETIAARMSIPAAGNASGAGSVNVTVELDRRKMGQAVVDIMNKEMALT